jgi:hypothetical protein
LLFYFLFSFCLLSFFILLHFLPCFLPLSQKSSIYDLGYRGPGTYVFPVHTEGGFYTLKLNRCLHSHAHLKNSELDRGVEVGRAQRVAGVGGFGRRCLDGDARVGGGRAWRSGGRCRWGHGLGGVGY